MKKIVLLAWISFLNVSANSDASDLTYSKEMYLNETASTNTYAQAINYGKSNPKRDGGSWNGW